MREIGARRALTMICGALLVVGGAVGMLAIKLDDGLGHRLACGISATALFLGGALLTYLVEG